MASGPFVMSGDSGTASLDQHGVAPDAGDVAGDTFAHADGAESMVRVQGERGVVVGEDRRLDRPDTGGQNDHATYRNHPGHAEAVEIVFDPTQTSYRDILAFFFQIHDPSTLNRQGNDIGTSYRSAIFPLSPEQEKVARDTIADVDASGIWPAKVVTTIEPEAPFWEAEPEHQDYLIRIPNGYTCHFVRPGWVLPKREEASA